MENGTTLFSNSIYVTILQPCNVPSTQNMFDLICELIAHTEVELLSNFMLCNVLSLRINNNNNNTRKRIKTKTTPAKTIYLKSFSFPYICAFGISSVFSSQQICYVLYTHTFNLLHVHIFLYQICKRKILAWRSTPHTKKKQTHTHKISKNVKTPHSHENIIYKQTRTFRPMLCYYCQRKVFPSLFFPFSLSRSTHAFILWKVLTHYLTPLFSVL